MSTVGLDKLGAAQSLLASEVPELASLRTERSRLQTLVHDKQVELEQQRSLLNKTLLDKDAVQKSLLVEKDNLHEAKNTRRQYLESGTRIRDLADWDAMEQRNLERTEEAQSSGAELAKHLEVFESLSQSDPWRLCIPEMEPSIKEAIEATVAKDILAYQSAGSDYRRVA